MTEDVQKLISQPVNQGSNFIDGQLGWQLAKLCNCTKPKSDCAKLSKVLRTNTEVFARLLGVSWQLHPYTV